MASALGQYLKYFLSASFAWSSGSASNFSTCCWHCGDSSPVGCGGGFFFMYCVKLPLPVPATRGWPLAVAITLVSFFRHPEHSGLCLHHAWQLSSVEKR